MSRMYPWVSVLGFCPGTLDRDKGEAAESYQRAVCLIKRGCVCSQLSSAQEDDDFSKARVMCGHVNMICKPELARTGCGQGVASEH